eukprot:4493530-Amphidinium_carterae.1
MGVQENVLKILGRCPSEVIKERLDMAKWLLFLSKENKTEDERLRKSMDVDVAAVLHDKSLATFRYLCERAGLVEDLCEGFRIVGELPASGILCSSWRPASIG